MKSKDKKPNIFKIIMLSFLAMYSILYVLDKTGYYNAKRKEKVVFTEAKIKEFEKDVAMGKNVDIDDYLEGTDKNYSNNFSKLGLSISNTANGIFNKGLKKVVGILRRII